MRVRGLHVSVIILFIATGGEASEELKHKNFLKGSNTFFETHQNEADVSGTGQQFKYPKLSENDYNS